MTLDSVQIPEYLPFMALPETPFFPHAGAPLNIFESHYLQMLEECLKSESIFALGSCTDSGSFANQVGPREPRSIATAGVIKACKKSEDGTYTLILKGIQRIYCLEWIKTTPYYVGRVEPIPTIPGSHPQNILLQFAKIKSLFAEHEEINPRIPTEVFEKFQAIDQPERYLDIMIHVATASNVWKQNQLEENNLTNRLLLTKEFLQEEIKKLRLQKDLGDLFQSPPEEN